MRNALKVLAGKTAHRLFPALSKEVEGSLIEGRASSLRKLIAEHHTREAAHNGNELALRKHLARYWQGSLGDEFYGAYPERFESWFLGEHFVLVEALQQQIEANSVYSKLIEVGCGDGEVLEFLRKRFDNLESLTGLDLNEGVIDRNRVRYQGDPKLHFECADLTSWLPEHTDGGTVILSYGGVLEYLPGEELSRLFFELREAASPLLLVLAEPIAADFDLKAEATSRPHGPEFSFSHPHRILLEKAGWKIEFECEKQIDHRWMLMIGSA